MARKTPQKTPSRTPKTGRGRLRTGNPGNRGGPGRPPDAIRRACRKSFDERLKLLRRFADDVKLDPSIRMKAIETLGKYGLGTTFTPTDTDGNTLPPAALAVQFVRPAD